MVLVDSEYNDIIRNDNNLICNKVTCSTLDIPLNSVDVNKLIVPNDSSKYLCGDGTF